MSQALNYQQAQVFISALKEGTDFKNIALGDVMSAVLSSNYLNYTAGVTGGGIGKQLAYFRRWDMNVNNSAFETSSVAEIMGALKPNENIAMGATYSTHMIGFVQAVSMMEYLCEKSHIPAIALVGANVDGKTGPTNFQNGTPEKYRGLFGDNMFSVEKETDPANYVKRVLGELKPMLNRMLLEGSAGFISMPYNLTSEKVKFSWDEFQQLTSKPDLSVKPLSEKAKAQLDQLVEAYKEEGSRLLYVLGSGMGHANRLSSGQALSDFDQLAGKMVGNIMVDIDNTHLLSGKSTELVTPSHVYDKNIDNTVRKSTAMVFIGGGPNAAVTFNRAGLNVYENMARKEKLFMIDSAANLAKWEPELKGMVAIEADPRAALEYLNSKNYPSPAVKLEVAKGAAAELKKLTNEAPLLTNDQKPIPGAEEMRAIHIAIASALKHEPGRVCVILDSGNSPGKMLKYIDFSKQNQPGNPSNSITTIYPDEGMLGYVGGATIGAIKSGKYDKVLVITGDGGGSYISGGEAAIMQEFSKKNNVATNLLVLSNGGHLSVEASFPLGGDSPYIKDLAYKSTGKEKVNYSEFSNIIPGASSVSAEATPSKIAQAIQDGFKKDGLNVIESDIRDIQHTRNSSVRS